MASSGLQDIAPRQGASVIAIRGAVHHLIGPLLPADGQPATFAQLYIIDDPQDELRSRMEALGRGGPALDRDLRDLQACLHTHNAYVRQIKQTKVGARLVVGAERTTHSARSIQHPRSVI
jgi:hypothetical protein